MVVKQEKRVKDDKLIVTKISKEMIIIYEEC